MGLRFRKSFKIGPARMTFSKSGVSKSIGMKGLRVTRTAKGKTKTTFSIPGSGLSYTSESGGRKKRSTTKLYKTNSTETFSAVRGQSVSPNVRETNAVKWPANPPKPPKSPKLYLPCGIFLAILGVFMLFFFWPFGMLSLGIGIYYITCGPKIYSKLVENYKAVHPEFDENKNA